MRVKFLGGANEVGASCALIETDRARILVDAGVRVSAKSQQEPYPDLRYLRDHPPDAVLVTHAHADHTGALPLLRRFGVDCPIYMTAPTAQVLEILQSDAIRHSGDADGDGLGVDGRLNADDLERSFRSVIPQRFNERFCPIPGRPDIQCDFIPCGHVYGAASIVIDTQRYRIGWLGDYSVSPQPTVGALDPGVLARYARERPFDFLLSEGTYGANVHPPRKKENARLIGMLERTCRKSGIALIPAFALGRGQDVLRIILSAKRKGRLKDVPVYADGMIKELSQIYQRNAHEFYGHLDEPLEIMDPNLKMYQANPQSRARLRSGEQKGPAIVVSSSGMLIGGQSVEWAKAIMPIRRNAVMIVGYQDEESPGRAVLNMKKRGRIRFPGDTQWTKVRCFVGKYGLSAHADFNQMRAVIEAARPKKLALVHGDNGALQDLRRGLKGTVPRRKIVIPECGDTVGIRPVKPRYTMAEVDPPLVQRRIERSTDSFEGRPRPAPGVGEIRDLWQEMLNEPPRSYTEREMVQMLRGREYSMAEYEITVDALLQQRLYFKTSSATGQRTFRPEKESVVREHLLLRAVSHQVSVETGDVVAFADGSGEVGVAVLGTVDRERAYASVAFQNRSDILREWIRARSGVNADKMARNHPKLARRWLEELVRKAREIDLSHKDLAWPDHEGRPVSIHELADATHPGPDVDRDVWEIAILLHISSDPETFPLNPDGTHRKQQLSVVG